MKYEYTPEGVCARKLEFDIQDGKVSDLTIHGGCNGNGQGIARLIDGMEVGEVIERLEGIRCSGRPTSCPAQLANALKQYEKNKD